MSLDRERWERLLDGNALEFAVPAIAAGAEDADPFEPGATIGPYRLVRRIALGGMSVVYMAEREEPYRQTVAIKVLQPIGGDDSSAHRFHVERQILAALDHPNIAQIIDGGVTSAHRPYLVMEFVDGKPITEHCERAGLTIEKRLELFEAVCEAVQHAHRNLVVHRDLKPGNILVRGDGTVKLLDFGIAKLLEPDAIGGGGSAAPATRTGLWLLTPEYAAPEQVSSRAITTATDVYALGAVLFELVTNVRPRELKGKSPTEIVDAVGGGELPAASSAAPADRARRLKGDIDTIIAKATRREPQERYASARDLAEDVRRHREGLPIAARSASIAYRGRRFVRRHRIAVLAAFAALAVGAYHMTQLTRERNRARIEAETATRVSDFLVDLFAESDPDRSRGATITAREILSRGAEKIEAGLAEEPLVRARLLATLGSVHRELGLYKEAQPLLERSLAIREEALESDHPDVAQSLHSLGVLLNENGEHERAREPLERALAIRESRLGPDHPDVAFSLSSLARGLYAKGDRQAARALYERALSIWEAAYGPDHPEVAAGASNLANLLADMGERGEARRLYDRAAAIKEKSLGSDHPSVAIDLNNIGVLLWDSGDAAGAIPYHERALAIREKAYGPNHRHVAQSLDNLAIVLNATGDVAGARARYERALAIRESALGPDHPDVGFTANNLGDLLKSAGDLDGARRLYERALSIWEKAFGPKNLYVGGALHNLACLHRDTSDFAQARPLFERAQQIFEAALGPDDPYVAENLEQHAKLLRAAGDATAAEALEARAKAIRDK